MSDKESSKSRREFITSTGAGTAAGAAAIAMLLGNGTAEAHELDGLPRPLQQSHLMPLDDALARVDASATYADSG